jgi:hypothetical protein
MNRMLSSPDSIGISVSADSTGNSLRKLRH